MTTDRTDSSDSENTVSSSVANQRSGGIDLNAQRIDVAGDVVGRDKITTVGYTVEQVQTLLVQIKSAFQPKPFDGRSPYLGLDAFTENDADRFFGRDTLVTELIERVKGARFLVMAGPSGSGKSSLARAGLLHQLKQGALPHSEQWLYATLVPGRDPIEALALAVSRWKTPELGDYLRQHTVEPEVLDKCAESALTDLPDQRAVIFVDQFEEIFTQVSKDTDRAAFLNLLTAAATKAAGRVTVLFALRSDFVSNCAAYPQLNALVNRQFVQVGVLRADELVSAIARPALEVGLRIDPDLITQIMNDMGDELGALPLMQFALKDLFDTEQAHGGLIALTLSDYLARGGLRQALERHADAAFAKLSSAEQQLARAIFAGLIEIGSGHQDTRRTASVDELIPASAATDRVKATIKKLADARLITTAEHDHQETITLSHERLIEAWPWLRKLIDDNREAIALQNAIASDAQDWNRNERDASYLYTGARLATAREQLADRKIVLNGLAQAFIDTAVVAEVSERQRETARHEKELADARKLAETERLRAEEQTQSAARLRRRGTYLIGVLGVVVLLGIVAAVFGIQSNRLANQNAQIASMALAGQLAAQALTHENDNFGLALLLNIQSFQVADTLEGRTNLLSLLQSSPRLVADVYGLQNESTFGLSENNVAISPNGQVLAATSCNQRDSDHFCQQGEIILWDISNRRAVQQLGAPLLTHAFLVESLAFSHDGKVLAAGGSDGTIIFWDLSDPRAPRQLGQSLTGHTKGVNGLAFSTDGKWLAAAGSFDNMILVWNISDLNSLTLVSTLTVNAGKDSYLSGIAFSPDSRWLVSGGTGGGIILWEAATGQELGELPQTLISDVWSVAFSPNGRTVAAGGPDGVIVLDVSDPRSPQPVGAPMKAHSNTVTSVAFSPDGQTLASGSVDQTIILWDMSASDGPRQIGKPLVGHADEVRSLLFDSKGSTLISGSYDGSLILWDVSTRDVPTPIATRLDDLAPVQSVAFSPNGKTLVSGCEDGSLIFWDVSNPQAPRQFAVILHAHHGSVWGLAFSPDGTTLASGSEDKTLILWDVSTLSQPQQLTQPLIGHTDWIASLAFSSDGKTLASGSGDQKVILWDVSNPRAVKLLGSPLTGHTATVRSIAFSPDGQLLASGDEDGAILLWNVSDPQQPKQMGSLPTRVSNMVSSVAFSPDGKTLASGHIDHTSSLWDVSNPVSPTLIGQPLFGHTDTLMSIAFSADKRTLATSSLDGTIILWDVSNLLSPQRLGAPLIGHMNAVNHVVFSPDGKMLASAGADGTVRLWSVDPAAWREYACQIVGRNLTQAEWKKYLGDEPYRQTCPQWPASQ